MKKLLPLLLLTIITITTHSQSLTSIADKLISTYTKTLNDLRADQSLLDQYAYSEEQPRHTDRLKLYIALFNDFKESDYEIARYLYQQEMQWRKAPDYYDYGEVDNLYFAAFLLSRYKQTEMVIDFWETKMIDFDAGAGFDGEYLLSHGIENTYAFLADTDHPLKEAIYKYIGPSLEASTFSEEQMERWVAFKYQYFENFIQPIANPMWLLYQTYEKELLATHFPSWIESNSEWNENELHRYRTYATYLDEIDHEIKALELLLAHKGEALNGDSYWATQLKEAKKINADK